MAEQFNGGVSIERLENLSIVSLKVSRKSCDVAQKRLASAAEPKCLWHGPDRCLLVSDSITADSLVNQCQKQLADVLHHAVDNSAGLALFRVVGPGARDLLAAGCGLDVRPGKFPVGSCCRTRLAQIAAVISAEGPEQFDIYVDRSYEAYLGEWLSDSLSIAASMTSPTGASDELAEH